MAPQVIVSRRIKRLSSIILKLRQNPTMNLTQMQDVGGCRAVVGHIREIEPLVAAYETSRAKSPSRVCWSPVSIGQVRNYP